MTHTMNNYPHDEMNFSIGNKFGCLQILDDGSEYLRLLNEQIACIQSELAAFNNAIANGELEKKENCFSWDGNIAVTIPTYVYKPVSFSSTSESIQVRDFDQEINKRIKAREIRHYQCRCVKCGKIRYYSEMTLLSEPKECFKPIFCSSAFTYSTKASNANYRKRNAYEENESVRLVNDRDAVKPDDEYCDSWNRRKENELKKKSEKENAIIASIPRRLADNYSVDYVGMRYESLDIIECTNARLESTPEIVYSQRHQKRYRDITVYKEYLCRCYLCGKEQKITCDKFGIYPPTPYGVQAYDGYWSKASCDCHEISSFQWIANDILIKHNVEYKVEVAFDGLFGIDGKTPLRFDFAIYNDDHLLALVECQGEQHYKPIVEFGGERGFAIQQRNDQMKRMFAKDHDIRLVEISYKNKKYEMVESILRKEGLL